MQPARYALPCAQVSSEPIYIVTEFMCHGSLLDYLKDGPGRQSSLVDQIDMAAQVPLICVLSRVCADDYRLRWGRCVQNKNEKKLSALFLDA